ERLAKKTASGSAPACTHQGNNKHLHVGPHPRVDQNRQKAETQSHPENFSAEKSQGELRSHAHSFTLAVEANASQPCGNQLSGGMNRPARCATVKACISFRLDGVIPMSRPLDRRLFLES